MHCLCSIKEEQSYTSDLLIATKLLTVGTHFKMMHLCQRMEDRLTSTWRWH